MAHNTVCHIELQAIDLGRARGFYETVFGWSFKQFTPDMLAFGNGDEHVGGLMRVDSLVTSTWPSIWLSVESVEATLKAVEAAGGSVASPKEVTQTVGYTAVFKDLDENHIGLVEFADV